MTATPALPGGVARAKMVGLEEDDGVEEAEEGEGIEPWLREDEAKDEVE